MRTLKSEDLIEFWLDRRRSDLEEKTSSEVIIIRTPLKLGVDNSMRDHIEELKETEDAGKPRSKLTVIIETGGGYIEVVERVYSVFRKHYSEVNYIVPNYAYSAGTVLVLSGDEIYMDYYSVLGPIDPQFESDDGQWVPGIGYLHKFNELVGKINEDAEGISTRAELAYLIKRFDPAKLFHIEQARDHSKNLLREWLPRHKFKNWTVRETTKEPVTEEYKKERADKIAEILSEPKRWHSHGRGIGIKDLDSEEIKLKVINFGEDANINSPIRDYYELFMDFCGKKGYDNAIHSRRGLRRLP